jgi:hypothetical protein
MALTVKMGTSGKKASDLAVGESIEGYLLGLTETKYNFAIKLLGKGSSKVETLFPNGNLAYMDQEIEDGNLTLNAYTKITRTGTRQSSKSRDPQTGEWRQVPVFQVAQDADDVITADAAADALSGDKADTDAEASGAANASSGSNKFANRKR